MSEIDLKKIIVQEILMRAMALKDRYTKEYEAKAAWVCIFSQNDKEYHKLLNEADKLGSIFDDTYECKGVKILLDKPIGRTIKILKIRKPDPKKLERGDADFTVSDYKSFKEENLKKENFSVIQKRDFEMIELRDKNYNVLAYFSNPPIKQQYKDFLIK